MDQADSSRITNHASEESASSPLTNNASEELASSTNHSSEKSASTHSTNNSPKESISSLFINPLEESASSPLTQPSTAPSPASPTVQSPPLLILFDGICNLCNSSVQFILKRDKTGRFFFASLQSPVGQAYLQKFGFPASELNSFILVEKDKAYTRSTAALRVLQQLGGGWKIFYALRILPAGLRDGVYNWIARHRYQWFGKRESCWLPTPELKKRFLD